jgi:hypothetical protein
MASRDMNTFHTDVVQCPFKAALEASSSISLEWPLCIPSCSTSSMNCSQSATTSCLTFLVSQPVLSLTPHLSSSLLSSALLLSPVSSLSGCCQHQGLKLDLVWPLLRCLALLLLSSPTALCSSSVSSSSLGSSELLNDCQ